MGIQLSGFNSGLPVNDIIEQLIALERRPIQLMQERATNISFEKSIVSNIEARVNTLLDSITSLTATSGLLSSDKDLFRAKTGSSSNDSIASLTVTDDATIGSHTLEVVSLATSTTAGSVSPVGQNITGASLVGDIGNAVVTDGDFNIFVDGNAYSISVASGDTMTDVFNRIKTAIDTETGGAVTLPTMVGGNIEVYAPSGTTVSFGSGADTTNFLQISGMFNASFTAGAEDSYTATRDLLQIDLSAGVSTAAAGLNTPVVDGTFEINGVSFDTTGKSMTDLIDEINTSSAGVTASFDMVNNAFELSADDAGSNLILLQDTGSNFLESMGLIVGGNSTTSQTAGVNATFNLDGNLLSSPTNSVSEAITGLAGVTINLESADPGNTITISVDQDVDALTDAIGQFVSDINQVISYIDEQTDAENDGPLTGEQVFIRLRQQLRQLVTTNVPALSGTAVDSMPIVGISTGAVTGSASSASSTFVFDEAKFATALANDPEAVRNLFKATTADDGYDGIFTQLKTVVEGATGTVATTGFDGVFAAYNTSADARIESINDSVTRAEDRLELKEARIRQQFTAMETLIGRYQQQGAALSGLQNQLSNNN